MSIDVIFKKGASIHYDLLPKKDQDKFNLLIAKIAGMKRGEFGIIKMNGLIKSDIKISGIMNAYTLILNRKYRAIVSLDLEANKIIIIDIFNHDSMRNFINKSKYVKTV